MPSVAVLPSLGPFGRAVDMRMWPHGFTTRQTNAAAGPAGSAIVRPNIEHDAWHAATATKWGGNIVWTGSTPRHTIAYNGPRGRYFGTLTAGAFAAMKTWFSHNGDKVTGPTGRVLGACVKTYADLPTSQTYTGTGTGALVVQTPSTAPGALTGDYEVRCIEATPTPRFLVTGPDLQPIGVAEAGLFAGAPVLFDSLVRFTLQSGAVPFVVGDAWILTVEEAEQFVVIATPDLDPTPRTETVWRRGVSLSPGSSWRQIASIAPVAGQVDGSIQPWFFNASATRAVTCRGLGADASGYTLGTVGRVLNLDTLAVTDAAEATPPTTYTETRVVTAVLPPESAYAGQAADVTFTNTTPDVAPAVQLMALDYDGNAEVRLEIEFSGSCSGTSHMWVLYGDASWCGVTDVSDGQYETVLSGSYSAHVDLVWRRAGGEVRRIELLDLAASGTQTDSWFCAALSHASAASNAYRHRVIRDIADPQGAALAITYYSGTVTSTRDGDGNGNPQQSAAGVTINHEVAGGVVSTVSGGSGPHAFIPSSVYWAMVRTWPGYEGDSGPPIIFPIVGVKGLGSAWQIGLSVGVAGPGGAAAVAATAATLPSVNTAAGKGFQTSAQDTRGNWLMAAEIASFGTADMRWPGSISASGTYTLKAGGPDALTPAQVASLTGYAPHDRWDVGAF